MTAEAALRSSAVLLNYKDLHTAHLTDHCTERFKKGVYHVFLYDITLHSITIISYSYHNSITNVFHISNKVFFLMHPFVMKVGSGLVLIFSSGNTRDVPSLN